MAPDLIQIRKDRLAFSVKRYRRVQFEFNREIGEGFPLLRQFEDAGAKEFLKMIRELPVSKQHLFAQALLKRFHVDAAMTLNEATNDEERSLIGTYIERVREGLATSCMGRDSTHPDSIPRRRLRELISKHIGDRFGKPTKCDLPGAIKVVSCTGNFSVHTVFYTAGRIDTLRYWHDVESESGDRVAELLSVLGSFGIAGMTMWSSVTKDQLDGVLGALDTACESFLASIRQLN